MTHWWNLYCLDETWLEVFNQDFSPATIIPYFFLENYQFKQICDIRLSILIISIPVGPGPLVAEIYW